VWIEGCSVTVGENEIRPAGPKPAPGATLTASPSDPDADTVLLPIVPAGAAAQAAAAAEDGARTVVRRSVPWWWIAAALLLLLLVGRGVVGAMGAGPGAPGPRPTALAASAAPAASSAASGAGTGAATATDPAAATTAPTAALTPPPPTVARVTRPLATSSTSTRPTATATATASATASATGRPRPPAPACSAAVSVTPYWGGYVATLTVTNTGGSALHGWTLTFGLPDRQSLIGGWNGRFTSSGTVVSVGNVGYNADVGPGGSFQVGFQVQAVGPGGPGGFTLDGNACS
jgi:hypothetical protein